MRYLALLLIFTIAACGNSSINSDGKDPGIPIPETGIWRFSLQLEKEQLPFNVEIDPDNSSGGTATIINGEERIEAKNFSIREDSVFIELPVFASELRGRIESPEFISGTWINKAKKHYRIPFVAEANKPYRFSPTPISEKLPGKYRVVFDPNTDDAWNAILLLNEDSSRYRATFLTETGDYRYLIGNRINETIYLSTFDGSHAFLFTAKIAGDSLINGTFTSASHHETPWKGVADKNFELRDPEKLTSLKPGFDKIDFRLPNQNGDTVSWDDLNLDGKVVVIDIMGSWCPNCMDANRALKKLSAPYSEDELIVMPIAYEISPDFDQAKKRITKMQTDLGMETHFLFGGVAKKENTASDFPMLNQIMSYPTIIFIGKNGKVRDIYTGFYGPGTGHYYDEFIQNTKTLLATLVAEEY